MQRAALVAGVFAIAGATLMYEILLTRIFSVTMWYHFAFLAVAAALLGMTAGALLVQARARPVGAGPPTPWLARSALLFALTVPLTFVLHLAIPVRPSLTATGLLSVLATYAVIAVPFLFSGITICLALTRSGGPVGLVYAADLAGAALGCLAIVGVLQVADAPMAVFAVAGVGGAAAAALAGGAGQRRLAVLALVTAVAALVVVVTRPFPLRLHWVKGEPETAPALYERWNSYSRVRIAGRLDATSPPFGWGLSPVYPTDRRIPQLLLSIDAIADTVLTRFDGDLSGVDHLRYDVTNLAYHIRPAGRVLVIGAGGGRDVLAALAFGQREVLAVEVNEAILDAVNGRFGEYTGHLDRRPGVRFVNDEARSYVARLDRQFDVVQVSFIDTFAATAAGAYVLTEHTLYTREAWRTFLDRLAPGGILTHSRWYFHRFPAEIYRLVSLATATLRDGGVARPRDHLALIRARTGADPGYREAVGVGTLLVGRDPLSAADVARLRGAAEALQFEVVLDPGIASDPLLAALTDPATFARAVAASPLDISPPTDERPFFFHTAPLRAVFRPALAEQGNVSFNVAAVVVLVGALGLAAVVTGACVVVPLVTMRRAPAGGGVRPAEGLYFTAIGLGFILVEISQLQRLSVFLGHPTLGLVVALFTLLLASGAGSFAVRRGVGTASGVGAVRPLLLLPPVLVAFGLLTPPVVSGLRALPTPGRILVAAILLAPIGAAMGAAFPRGLDLATRRSTAGAPWLWAINGAASVFGSLLAVLVSISAGVSAAYWLGVAAYAVAAATGLRLAGTSDRAPRPLR
jgi:hypothetical protein